MSKNSEEDAFERNIKLFEEVSKLTKKMKWERHCKARNIPVKGNVVINDLPEPDKLES